MNLIQDVLDAILGTGVLTVSEVSPDIVYVSVLLFFFWVYLALRSTARFFLSLGSKF